MTPPGVRVGLAAALVALAWSIGGTGVATALADTATPYTDPHAYAALALCGKDGKPVTSGSVDARPFVWRAVSARPAPSPYDRAGRTATLFAYQPRAQVEPGEWSGDLLTASARYTNASHPMAQATDLDGSLAEFLDAYPTKVDGFVQLRLYLGAPAQPAFTQRYAAANIQVSGTRWHLVGSPAAVSCTSGSAVSLEVLLPTPGPSASRPSAPASAMASSALQSSRPGAGSSAPAAGSAAPVAAAASGSPVADSGDGWQNAVVVGLLAVAAVAAVVWWWWPMRPRARDER